jgi:hypothetical protein
MKTLNNKAFGPLASLGLSGVICMATVTGCDGLEVENKSSQGGTQPQAKIVSVSDTHWGVEIGDSYRYMENLEDPEVEN